jgi:hypothetical protein
MRRTRYVILAAFAIAVLALVPGFGGTGWSGHAEAATQAGQRAGGDGVGQRLHDGAKDFGDGLLDGVKFVGRTVISPFTGSTNKVGRDADAVGKHLHRGAKDFGEGLLDGMKFAGRTIVGFFNGDKGGR